MDLMCLDCEQLDIHPSIQSINKQLRLLLTDERPLVGEDDASTAQ